ncbi:DUF3883 domain-containing protein [Actinocorallia sp. API 0066]|uniref:protein NO VEIN domain-containing protein n=1 Tax=Actinocorallia sp. API 0066 TaxID=2896846 RepID=UPI001E3C6775|nr:DUF3883 domain-containing protein [Actinocorallia sp. API 0066]MCD0450405.1 DUF3883 domain-containing protein [Actinocorallia sp. API 0066]
MDLDFIAGHLISGGLAQFSSGRIVLGPQLTGLIDLGAAATLRDAARILLAADPPVWLSLAVSMAGVTREYIPAEDLAALRWLEPELDQILLNVRIGLDSSRQDELRKRIGNAAEFLVLAALRYVGLKPIHAAQVSDAFGYDIEVRAPKIDRIEVKAAGPKTRGCFHLSRNEFEKSQKHATEWRLIQVVFTSAAFVAEEIDISHVQEMIQVSSKTLRCLVPPDTRAFSWQESALITSPDSAWGPSGLRLDPDFKTPGIKSVG